MAHPLYHQATRLVGQPIFIQHMNGQVHHGTLMSVNRQGIYVLPHPQGTRLVNHSLAEEVRGHHAVAQTEATDLDLVYGPAMFFGFGALAGLTAAAAFSPWYW